MSLLFVNENPSRNEERKKNDDQLCKKNLRFLTSMKRIDKEKKFQVKNRISIEENIKYKIYQLFLLFFRGRRRHLIYIFN